MRTKIDRFFDRLPGVYKGVRQKREKKEKSAVYGHKMHKKCKQFFTGIADKIKAAPPQPTKAHRDATSPPQERATVLYLTRSKISRKGATET